jgi:REP element-mobilizing transposase RayT
MNRGVDHQPIFRTDADRLEMGQRLADLHERFGVTTLAYCLMGNHLHLVLHAPDGGLPHAMHHLTSVYSHHFNTRHRRDGPLFRGRYHSIPVESDAYLLWVARYVHRNPLDLAGVASPRDYRWSSYRAYLGLRPCPTFLDRQPVMDLVGCRVDELATVTEDVAPVRLRSSDDVVRLVRCARAVDDMSHGDADRRMATIDRTLLVLLERRCCDPAVRRLVSAALGSETSARARQRAEVRVDQDPVVSRTLRWLEDQLATRRHAVPGTA